MAGVYCMYPESQPLRERFPLGATKILGVTISSGYKCAPRQNNPAISLTYTNTDDASYPRYTGYHLSH
jgi:hypothetical protein